jgi:SnoaL-like domain
VSALTAVFDLRPHVAHTSGYRVDVRACIDSITEAYVRRDWPRFAHAHAPDAVWERVSPTPWVVRGREAVVQFSAMRASRGEVLMYMVSPLEVTRSGPGRACARSRVSEVLRLTHTGRGLHIVGAYDDELVETEGRWLLRRRVIRLEHMVCVGVATAPVRGVSAAGSVGPADVAEPVYRIYTESFKGVDHARQILGEAQAIVDRALAGAG